MAFKSKKKKNSDFVSVGSMFKSDKQYLPKNAAFGYSTTVKDQYLTAVVEELTRIHEAGGAARFSLIKWADAEHPRMTVSEAKKKPGKRIQEEDESEEEGEEGL